MKKLFALTLALCLLASLALAEPKTVDCEAFTLTVEDNVPQQMGEKAEQATLLALYPCMQVDGDNGTTLTVSWSGQTEEINAAFRLLSVMGASEEVVKGFAQGFTTGISSGLEQVGIAVANSEVSNFGFDKKAGKDTLSFTVRYDLDYSGFGSVFEGITATLYQRYWVVPTDDGMYIFMATSTISQKIEQYCEPIMDTLAWK